MARTPVIKVLKRDEIRCIEDHVDRLLDYLVTTKGTVNKLKVKQHVLYIKEHLDGSLLR